MPRESIEKSALLRGNFFKDFLGSLAALWIGLFAAFIPFLLNPRFYFNDDEQNCLFPYFVDIGQHLRHHQWPGLTLSTFYGGNLMADWQYALLNPFSLLVSWALCSTQNLLLMGLALAGIYLGLLALGGYWLGRVFALSRLFSLSIAAALSMNNFMQYMYGDSWIICLVSIAWFIWAWVFLEQYRRRGQTLILAGLACSIYLTITSGFPQTMIMLGFLMVAYFMEFVFVQRSPGKALKLALVNLGSLLATAPFLLPALLSFSWMVRPSGIHSTGLLMPDLGSVLNLSSIFLFPRILLYGHEYPSYPMMYLAWYIIPLLPLVCWQVAANALRNRFGIIVVAAVSLVLLFGPENIGPIRYPMRFLPYFHIALLLAFFLVISIPGIFWISKLRLKVVLVILLFQFSTAFSVRPDTFYLQLLGLILGLALVLAAARFIYFNDLDSLGLILLGGTLTVFACTHVISPRNGDLGDFHPPIQNNTALPTVAQPFSGYQLYMGPLIFDNTKEARIAAQGIFSGYYTINGYCALGHQGLRPGTFGYNWFEMRDTSGVDFLLATEPTTHKSILSLMRVNRLLVFNGYFDHAKPLLGNDWIQTSKGEFATVLDSAAPDRALTTLSFASDGIVAQPTGEVTGEHEQWQITANPNGGQLVFARLYWPGYEASLNGRPIAVSPLDNVFVKLDLPAGSQGELTLKFVPPGWTLALVLAALGAALCCATLLVKGAGDLGTDPRQAG